jgi:hypothetical protein
LISPTSLSPVVVITTSFAAYEAPAAAQDKHKHHGQRARPE